MKKLYENCVAEKIRRSRPFDLQHNFHFPFSSLILYLLDLSQYQVRVKKSTFHNSEPNLKVYFCELCPTCLIKVIMAITARVCNCIIKYYQVLLVLLRLSWRLLRECVLLLVKLVPGVSFALGSKCLPQQLEMTRMRKILTRM